MYVWKSFHFIRFCLFCCMVKFCVVNSSLDAFYRTFQMPYCNNVTLYLFSQSVRLAKKKTLPCGTKTHSSWYLEFLDLESRFVVYIFRELCFSVHFSILFPFLIPFLPIRKLLLLVFWCSGAHFGRTILFGK